MKKTTLGKMIQVARKEKNWTAKTFIEKLGEDISPSYITKIEVHNEIPSPSLICKIAKVLSLDEQKLWSAAKTSKVKNFEDTLEKKYQQAVHLYKIQKTK